MSSWNQWQTKNKDYRTIFTRFSTFPKTTKLVLYLKKNKMNFRNINEHVFLLDYFEFWHSFVENLQMRFFLMTNENEKQQNNIFYKEGFF